MFESKTTQELIQIASAGGGFTLAAAPRTTQELIQIASAGSRAGARLVFHGMAPRTTQELIQIGSAGKGSVSFEA